MPTIPYKILNSGFSIPVLGLGTWRMGGDGDTIDRSHDIERIDGIKNSIESGITLIDTAELYGQGHADELIHDAITGYDRKKLFITSKVNKTHMTYDGILDAARQSLDRVGTDYFNLYLIHFPKPIDPREKIMQAMDELVRQGLTKHIGVCNCTTETLQKIQSYTSNKIVLNQCHYNLIYRQPEQTGLVQYCQENDIILQARRPVQYGDIVKNKNPLMDELAQKYNKTYAQIAINRLFSQDNVTTLVKMTSKDHIQDNLGAIGRYMDAEDIEKLRKNYPGQQAVSDRVPLS